MPEIKNLLQLTMSDLRDLKNAIFEIKKIIQNNSVILMSGDLSAGKTTFISAFVESFGIHNAQSPTYAIHQRYQNQNTTIDHFDLYRLHSEEELDSAGFYDLLSYPTDYKFIEWPQRLKMSSLPTHLKIYLIEITLDDQNKRTLKLYEKN